jgi:hypothetical protein
MRSTKHLYACLAIALVCTATPAVSFADQNSTNRTTSVAPPLYDPGAETTEEPSGINRPMFFAGFTLLAFSYGFSAVVAASNERKADDNLYYPVAGPWMDLANRDCNVRRCTEESLNKGLLITDGILQGVGALWTVMSFVVPEQPSRKSAALGSVGPLQLSPARIGKTGYGLAAVGTF